MNQVIIGAAVPSGENAAMVSNIVGYVESGSRVVVRNNVINVNFDLNGFAKVAEKLLDCIKDLADKLTNIGNVLGRLLPNEWHLSLSIGHCSNSSAPRLN